MAKAQVESNPHASPALKEFARIRPEDAETACHEVLTKYGFSVPIPVETLNIGPGQLKACPFVRPSAWATYLLNKGILPRQLVGVADRAQMEETLREHWKRYQVLFPNHPIFRLALEGTVQLQRCVPILSHSDEGRSTKHLPLFVMSFHGALGRGTQLYVQKQKHLAPLHRRQFGLNFLGQSWGTQFLCFAILREMVDDNPDALKTLIQHFARDFQQLAEEGIVGDDAYRVWLIHISTKGDLPALTKLSNSGRSFWHVARAATSRKPCDGICHLCKAGSEKPPTPYPFEDFSLSPKWAATLYDIPWGQLPPILEGVLVQPGSLPAFFKIDIWHTFHLGIAKHWIASSFISLIERLDDFPSLDGGSVDSKLAWMAQDFASFCKQNRISPHSREISRRSLSFPASSAWPIATWSKGSMATHLMKYLENLCSRFVVGKTQDEVLCRIAPQ